MFYNSITKTSECLISLGRTHYVLFVQGYFSEYEGEIHGIIQALVRGRAFIDPICEGLNGYYYQYLGYTCRHLVDSDLSCHTVLWSTCRRVKRFHSSFHTNNMGGNHSCQCVMDSLMIHRSIQCLTLFKISRKISPFLCSLSVLLVGDTHMVGHVDHIPRMHCVRDYCTIWCYTNMLSRVLRIGALSFKIMTYHNSMMNKLLT